MANINESLGTDAILAVVNLQSKASSATVGWISALVDNTTTLALDYEVYVSLPTAASAPANDKAVHVKICAAHKDNGGIWRYSDGGTTSLPTAGDASYTITADPGNNFDEVMTLAYGVTSAVIQGTTNLSRFYGLGCMPDGFLVFILNYSGAALSTGCVVEVRPCAETVV